MDTGEDSPPAGPGAPDTPWHEGLIGALLEFFRKAEASAIVIPFSHNWPGIFDEFKFCYEPMEPTAQSIVDKCREQDADGNTILHKIYTSFEGKALSDVVQAYTENLENALKDTEGKDKFKQITSMANNDGHSPGHIEWHEELIGELQALPETATNGDILIAFEKWENFNFAIEFEVDDSNDPWLSLYNYTQQDAAGNTILHKIYNTFNGHTLKQILKVYNTQLKGVLEATEGKDAYEFKFQEITSMVNNDGHSPGHVEWHEELIRGLQNTEESISYEDDYDDDWMIDNMVKYLHTMRELKFAYDEDPEDREDLPDQDPAVTVAKCKEQDGQGNTILHKIHNTFEGHALTEIVSEYDTSLQAALRETEGQDRNVWLPVFKKITNMENNSGDAPGSVEWHFRSFFRYNDCIDDELRVTDLERLRERCKEAPYNGNTVLHQIVQKFTGNRLNDIVELYNSCLEDASVFNEDAEFRAITKLRNTDGYTPFMLVFKQDYEWTDFDKEFSSILPKQRWASEKRHFATDISEPAPTGDTFLFWLLRNGNNLTPAKLKPAFDAIFTSERTVRKTVLNYINYQEEVGKDAEMHADKKLKKTLAMVVCSDEFHKRCKNYMDHVQIIDEFNGLKSVFGSANRLTLLEITYLLQQTWWRTPKGYDGLFVGNRAKINDVDVPEWIQTLVTDRGINFEDFIYFFKTDSWQEYSGSGHNPADYIQHWLYYDYAWHPKGYRRHTSRTMLAYNENKNCYMEAKLTLMSPDNTLFGRLVEEFAKHSRNVNSKLPTLHEGCRVRLHGLSKTDLSEYNEANAIVLKEIKSNRKWRVEVNDRSFPLPAKSLTFLAPATEKEFWNPTGNYFAMLQTVIGSTSVTPHSLEKLFEMILNPEMHGGDPKKGKAALRVFLNTPYAPAPGEMTTVLAAHVRKLDSNKDLMSSGLEKSIGSDAHKKLLKMHETVTKMMIDHGADLGAVNADGNTLIADMCFKLSKNDDEYPIVEDFDYLLRLLKIVKNLTPESGGTPEQQRHQSRAINAYSTDPAVDSGFMLVLKHALCEEQKRDEEGSLIEGNWKKVYNAFLEIPTLDVNRTYERYDDRTALMTLCLYSGIAETVDFDAPKPVGHFERSVHGKHDRDGDDSDEDDSDEDDRDKRDRDKRDRDNNIGKMIETLLKHKNAQGNVDVNMNHLNKHGYSAMMSAFQLSTVTGTSTAVFETLAEAGADTLGLYDSNMCILDELLDNANVCNTALQTQEELYSFKSGGPAIDAAPKKAAVLVRWLAEKIEKVAEREILVFQQEFDAKLKELNDAIEGAKLELEEYTESMPHTNMITGTEKIRDLQLEIDRREELLHDHERLQSSIGRDYQIFKRADPYFTGAQLDAAKRVHQFYGTKLEEAVERLKAVEQAYKSMFSEWPEAKRAAQEALIVSARADKDHATKFITILCKYHRDVLNAVLLKCADPASEELAAVEHEGEQLLRDKGPLVELNDAIVNPLQERKFVTQICATAVFNMLKMLPFDMSFAKLELPEHHSARDNFNEAHIRGIMQQYTPSTSQDCVTHFFTNTLLLLPDWDYNTAYPYQSDEFNQYGALTDESLFEAHPVPKGRNPWAHLLRLKEADSATRSRNTYEFSPMTRPELKIQMQEYILTKAFLTLDKHPDTNLLPASLSVADNDLFDIGNRITIDQLTGEAFNSPIRKLFPTILQLLYLFAPRAYKRLQRDEEWRTVNDMIEKGGFVSIRELERDEEEVIRTKLQFRSQWPKDDTSFSKHGKVMEVGQPDSEELAERQQRKALDLYKRFKMAKEMKNVPLARDYARKAEAIFTELKANQPKLEARRAQREQDTIDSEREIAKMQLRHFKKQIRNGQKQISSLDGDDARILNEALIRQQERVTELELQLSKLEEKERELSDADHRSAGGGRAGADRLNYDEELGDIRTFLRAPKRKSVQERVHETLAKTVWEEEDIAFAALLDRIANHRGSYREIDTLREQAEQMQDKQRAGAIAKWKELNVKLESATSTELAMYLEEKQRQLEVRYNIDPGKRKAGGLEVGEPEEDYEDGENDGERVKPEKPKKRKAAPGGKKPPTKRGGTAKASFMDMTSIVTALKIV